MSVPKKQRVTRALFDRVFKEGYVLSEEHVYVKVLRDETLPYAHYAVVVPKKIYKKAVLRNTLKRKGYASIRTHIKNRTPFKGVLLFFLKKGADTVSFTELSKEFNTLLQQVVKI